MLHSKISWINDHTQVCDWLGARVQLMQDYLNSKTVNRDALGNIEADLEW